MTGEDMPLLGTCEHCGVLVTSSVVEANLLVVINPEQKAQMSYTCPNPKCGKRNHRDWPVHDPLGRIRDLSQLCPQRVVRLADQQIRPGHLTRDALIDIHTTPASELTERIIDG